MTKGPRDLSFARDTPPSQDGIYQLGAPFQLSSTQAGMNPETGERMILSTYPFVGGFVPLGARCDDGTPHPHAGSGFAVCTQRGYPVHARSSPLAVDRPFERHRIQQYSYDGRAWEQVIHERGVRNSAPVTLNRAAAGTLYWRRTLGTCRAAASSSTARCSLFGRWLRTEEAFYRPLLSETAPILVPGRTAIPGGSIIHSVAPFAWRMVVCATCWAIGSWETTRPSTTPRRPHRRAAT